MNRREFGKMAGAAGMYAAAQPSSSRQRVRFSCMLWALEKQAPFDRCLDWVAQAGYQGIELVGEFAQWSPGEKAGIKARLRSLGLVIDAMSGVKAGFAVPAQSAAFRTQFGAHVRTAKELGCARVILLSGNRVDGLQPAAQRQAAIDSLKWAADLAAKEQVEIVIEPIDLLENPEIYLASVTDGFAVAAAVGSDRVKVLYDVYHEQRSFGNLIEKLEKNIHMVGLVHIADVPGRHEPGTGEIDYSQVYRTLAALKYEGWLAMEYYPTGEPAATLRKSRLDAQQWLS